MYAAYFQRCGVVDAILNLQDVDVTLNNKAGFTALSWAVSNNAFDAIERLLQHGKVDINEPNKV